MSEAAGRMIRGAMTLLQVFTLAEFGCGNVSQHFERNVLKKTTKGNHWGDLRARLELAIEHITEIASERHSNDSDYTSDSDDHSQPHPTYHVTNEKLTQAVRKELCGALRDLFHHGLNTNGSSGVHPNQMMVVPLFFTLGCFSTRSQASARGVHAWDIILKYYELKNGYLYNASPARKLSQSFNLQIVGGMAITPKQTFLSCIHDIIQTHTKLKRSPDSHFKAFVCAALKWAFLMHF